MVVYGDGGDSEDGRMMELMVVAAVCSRDGGCYEDDGW